MLDQHGVGVGVEVSERLKFRNPTPEDLVSNHELSGFVINFKKDIFAKIVERNFRAQTGAEVPNLVRPLFEFLVVGHAAIEGDRFVFRAARRFAAAARIAAFAMFDDFGCAFKRADFADACNIFAVPFNAKLEVLVRVESLCVYAKLSHKLSPRFGFVRRFAES